MTSDQIMRARQIAALVALCAGGAVLAQAGLNIARAAEKGQTVLESVLSMYGYFTIWTNTLVALVAGRYAAAGPGQGLFNRPATLAATTVYIIVVGLIYNLLLARYNPVTGFRLFIDTMLHSVVPIAYTGWWLLLVPRVRLEWRALLTALPFPTAYAVVALVRGAVTGKYAYFFIDIGKYGLPQVLVNIVLLVLFFAGLMALLIALDRRLHGRATPSTSLG